MNIEKENLMKLKSNLQSEMNLGKQTERFSRINSNNNNLSLIKITKLNPKSPALKKKINSDKLMNKNNKKKTLSPIKNRPINISLMNNLNYQNFFSSKTSRKSNIEMYKKIDNRKKLNSSRSINSIIVPKNIINHKKETSNFSISSIKDNDYSNGNRTLSLIKVPYKNPINNDNLLNDHLDHNNNNRLVNNEKKYHFEDFKFSKHYGNVDKCPICQAQKMKNTFYEKSIGFQNDHFFINKTNSSSVKSILNFKKKKEIKQFPRKKNEFDKRRINLNENQRTELEYFKLKNGENLFNKFDNPYSKREKEKDNSISLCDKYTAILHYFNP
jgi:hypothetical protein